MVENGDYTEYGLTISADDFRKGNNGRARSAPHSMWSHWDCMWIITYIRRFDSVRLFSFHGNSEWEN